MNNVFLASISFGNHTLHHLFPTVDHSKLPYLQEALLETCKEFDIKFEVYTPWETFKGLYLQLATIKPNLSLSSIMKKM
ncbi:cytochrome b5-related protein [Armadillidium vulgare]|nr:cytochrome b5-related protein [Armadillidium vulgare]